MERYKPKPLIPGLVHTLAPYVQPMRLDHWFKNLLVPIGSIGAIKYFQVDASSSLIKHMLLALILSCLISSANYIVNEILDAPFDKLHPYKKNRSIARGEVRGKRLYTIAFIITSLALGIASYIGTRFLLSLLSLLVAGILYNVRPIRTKDKPFLDVVSESVNNPLRLTIGWYAVYPGATFPPLSFLSFFWVFGAFLMTAKRLAEYRYLKDDASSYRPTFKHYSQLKLLAAMVSYAALSIALYIFFSLAHHEKLLTLTPLVVILLAWYFILTFQRDSIVKDPERLFHRPYFLLYSVLVLLLSLYVVFC